MNTLRLRYLFTFLFALVLLASCKDDKDEPAPGKADLLAAHEWRGDRAMLNDEDVSKRDEIVNMFLDIKTMRLQLKKDGTFVATYLQAGKPQTTNGKWALTNNEAKINFEGFAELDIKTLTPETLELTATLPQRGQTYRGEVRFIR